MAISHAFSNAVADATGTLTIWYGATTATVAATDIVRPSDWNSAHDQFLTIAGNTAGQSTFSGSNIVIGGGPNITISGVNATRFDISAGAGGAGDGFNILAAGTQTAATNTTVAFANSNGITFGMSDSSQITASHNGLTSQSNQAVSAANGSYAFQTLSLSNANGVSFGTSAGSAITASYTVPTVTNSSWTVSDNGTSGTVARLAFTNLNGVTLSLSTGAGGSHTIVGSHNALTSQSNQAFSAGAASSTFQTLSFQDSNGISFSNNAGAIRATYTRNVASNAIASVGSATNSGTNTSRFAADDHVHAGVFSVGVSNVGNTAGDTRVDVGRFVLAGGANITLSQATAANALNTISIVGATAAGSPVNFSAGTTSNDLGSVVFSNSNGVSFGLNGSTITASVAAAGGFTYSGYLEPADRGNEHVVGQKGQGTFFVQPMWKAPNFQFDQFVMPINFSNSSNLSGSATVSFWVGLYTRNVSTLSLLMSTSKTVALTMSGTAGSYSLFAGPRNFTIPWTTTVSQSDYWIGIGSRTTTGGANMSISQFLASQPNSVYSGVFEVASNATKGGYFGQGFYSATTSSVPGSIAFTQINASGSLNRRPPLFWFNSASI
jgi:hypothetical protein